MTASTHPGCRHDDNQDYYRAGRLADDTHWLILCDGMGGVSSGGVASEMATTFLSEGLRKRLPDLLAEGDVRAHLLDAAEKANDLILAESQKGDTPVTMGTTMVMAVVRGNLLQMVHAGDSRLYVCAKNSFKQLTHDHSIVQELLDIGRITAEQAYSHPNKNIITSALGVDATTRIDYNEHKLSKGDLLLACSDGLTNMIQDSEIAASLRESDFYTSAERLVQMAVEAGGYDNITAIVLEME